MTDDLAHAVDEVAAGVMAKRLGDRRSFDETGYATHVL